MPSEPELSDLDQQSLLDALRGRRSRRFGVGMQMPSGPPAYSSSRLPLPLTEDEEALLAFAACGVTGPALGDLVYTPGGGGTIMSGLAGARSPAATPCRPSRSASSTSTPPGS